MNYTQAACLAILLWPLSVSAQDLQTTRGIYIEHAKPGIRWDVLLIRGNERMRVTEDYSFKTGDRFVMQVEVNKPLYVYLINRTVNGNPDQLRTKGIQVIAEEAAQHPDSSRVSDYRLIFPTSERQSNLLQAGRMQTIPIGQMFRMDETPGIEKMLLIASPTPLDLLRKQIRLSNGQLVAGVQRAPIVANRDAQAMANSAPPSTQPTAGSSTTSGQHSSVAAGSSNDTNDDIHNRLLAMLNDYSSNAETGRNTGEKGIVLPPSMGGPTAAPVGENPTGTSPNSAPIARKDDTCSYGVAKVPSKPASFEITLRHYAN